MGPEMNKPTTIIAVVLLAIFIVLAWLAFYFHGIAVEAGGQVERLKRDNGQQAALIGKMHEQDTRNRILMAEQQIKEQALRQQGETYQRKFREAIQGNKCAAERLPDGVLDLLQQPTSPSSATGIYPAP